jgi:hypothetical protein
MLLLLCSIVGVALLVLPGAASAQDLQGYRVKLTGWPGWPNDQAGNAVAIGDVNGDGIPDYVVGDTMAGPNGRPQAGSVYVVYGQASDKTTARTVDLAQIPLQGQGASSLGYRIDGWSAYDHFGASVAVGDVNSDGVGDIVVGDPDSSPYGRSHGGNVYVIYGQKGTGTAEIDVSNLTAGQGTVITGWAAGDRTGQSVAVGRFNSDSPYGCKYASTENSVAVGAPGAGPNGQNQAGEVYDLYGSDFLSQPGALDLNNLSSANGYLIEGHWANDQLGQSIADGGDVNHNCSDAMLIGDPQAGPNGMPQSGTVYVAYGKPRSPNNSNEDVSTLGQNGQGYRINGPGSYARYGASVANAGDIDGDGIPDVIAGAPNYNSGAGEAIVTYGENGSNAGDINTSSLSPSTGYALQGSTKDQTLNGTLGTPIQACGWFTAWSYGGSRSPNATSVTAEGDRVGTTVAGVGDVNSDGVPDVLIGTPGWNDSAGAVAVIDGHRGRTQGNLTLSGLSSSHGAVLADGNTPPPEVDHPYGGFANDGSSWLVKPQSEQIQEQTEEAVNEAGPWTLCSNYMAERGDQAGSALASTTSGTGGFALVGAPTQGPDQLPRVAWLARQSNRLVQRREHVRPGRSLCRRNLRRG